ncbi:MAG: glycosyltransferase [Rectinemataceae bacterium]|nr:glycosyltransferase [Rectinemataceae bacterium]
MNLGAETLILAVIFFLWLDIIIVLKTLANKTSLGLRQELRREELREMAKLFEMESIKDNKKVRRLFDNYLMLKQSIDLPDKERERVLQLAHAEKMEPILRRRIRYRDRHERMEASLGLGLIGSEGARKILETALVAEKDIPTRLYMANSLADIGDPRSLAVLVNSLCGAQRWYRDKVNMLIASFGPEADEFLRGYLFREESEIKELFLDMSGSHISGTMKDYLYEMITQGKAEVDRLSSMIKDCPEHSCVFCVHGQHRVDERMRNCRYKGKVSPDYHCRRFRLLVTSRDLAANYRRLMLKAAECLEKDYASMLNSPEFLDHDDPAIRAIAIRSLGQGKSDDNIRQLVACLGDDSSAEPAALGLSRIIANHPRLTPSVVMAFENTHDKNLKQRLAEVLAARIDYFIAKLSSREKAGSIRLLHEIIEQGKVSEIIEFLKLNKDSELEDSVLAIIREELEKSSALQTECGLYLPDRILEKLGMQRVVPPVKKREEKRDWKMIQSLYVILTFAILFFPLVYLLRYGSLVFHIPLLTQIQTFVVDFNYNFAWYSLAVNAVYLILLFLSTLKVKSSTRLWNLKTMSFLFKPRILPTVSIIAPAYNEEKTIIQSSISLLNLKYPDYELVVVNDGSRDKTLNTIIEHYNLKRTDTHFAPRLKTAAVRGIYKNPLYPRLVVVDKENGGKADSLNAGINVASREYFCGIDADSLLEPDALLKVAALSLDYGVETPAMGGNIFPINGCEVDRGTITHIALPRNNLAKLQTIEYLRAFMCGRLGWAQINSLLIISGAFGLFRRERVIAAGGYLTSNERYGRDTVGEDMELVVRVSRLMREKKQKYRISYAYNANCWTEVPEDLAVLRRQRDRWHRGLVDILFFHRKLLFNPAYGSMGLLGMPYFLIFELIGPLFEIQGYLMVAIAAVFGLMSVKLAIILFITTIFMGVLISVSSVLIAERQLYYFNYRDTLKLLGIAIVENFGIRQLFSMSRVLGFISAMKKPKGWGKMERKGFAPTPAAQGKAGSGQGQARR